MKPAAKGVLLTILSAMLFGLNPLFTKTAAAAGCSTLTLAFVRMLCGSVIFFFVHRLSSRCSIRVTRRQFRQILLCSLGYTLTVALLLSSYSFIASGLATTIHFIYPVLVLVGCVLFRGEQVSRRMIVCCALCMLGVVCFYTPGGGIDLTGVLIAAGSAVAFAFYVVYLGGSGLLELPAARLMFWMCVTGGVFLLAALLAPGQFSPPHGALGWIFTVLSGCASAVALLAFQLGNRYIGAQKASLLSVFEPVTSVLVGVTVYREVLTFRSVLGVGLVLLSVCLVAFARDKAAQGADAAAG